jgi:hypothetical protein
MGAVGEPGTARLDNGGGGIKSIEKPSDLTENGNPDLPAGSIVPQPNTLARAPILWHNIMYVQYVFTVNEHTVMCMSDYRRGLVW